MIEKEFIPYEQALALKEIGFNEICFGYFHKFLKADLVIYPQKGCVNSSLLEAEVSAPTYQQAFRWFREKHKIDAWVVPFKNLDDEKQYSYIIDELSFIEDPEDFYTYEEAELECLKKLIEKWHNKIIPTSS